MKFTFRPEETAWLHEFINQVLIMSKSREDFAPMARTAAKMRYKFHGLPKLVYLGGKERALLSSMIDYRIERMETDLTNPERTLLKELRAKL